MAIPIAIEATDTGDNIEGLKRRSLMEIPGKVSLYCPLIDVKGTVGTLVSVSDHGYYHVEVPIKGHNHVMLLPIAHTALYFAEPEPEAEEGFEIER